MELLRIGSRGSDVRLLQEKLGVKVDGVFGKDTLAAVKNFQDKNGLAVDGIVGKNTWAKLNDKCAEDVHGASVRKSSRNIKEIIVHCAATPEGKDFTVADIKKWHLQRGFDDVGYHYIIYRDGTIHLGRDVDIAGAHCKGHNSISIGICYIGGVDADGKTPKDTRTPQQKKSMLDILKKMRELYPSATIHGHCEFANKACPSFDAREEYKDI